MTSRKWIVLAFLAAFSGALASPAQAEDVDIIALGWLDHLTFGLTNTAIGLPIALLGWGINAVRGRAPGLVVDSTGQQLIFQNSSWNHFEYSTGAIHHSTGDGGWVDAHEAGHGKQSAILGPAFLPLVGLTYLAQGLDEGHMEDWASAWSNLGSTMKSSHNVRLLVETDKWDDRRRTWIGAEASILEKASRIDIEEGSPTAVVYRYGKIGASILVTPPQEGQARDSRSRGLKLNVVPFSRDFAAEWSTVLSIVQMLINSRQATGAIAIDLDRSEIDFQAISHQLDIGAGIGDRKLIRLDLLGSASGSVEKTWFIGQDATRDGRSGPMRLIGGVGAEGRLHVLGAAEAYARKTKEWGTGGYSRETRAIGVETPALFGPGSFTANAKGGKLGGDTTRLYAGVKYQDEKERYGNGAGKQASPVAHRIRMTIFTLGGRF